VFFVHGFMGNAHSTWLDFQSLVDSDSYAQYWERIDLFFYDYETTSANVLVQSGRFRQFVEEVFPVPARLDLHPTMKAIAGDWTPLPLATNYESAVFVGHSLGGVIVRQMVVEAASDVRSLEEQVEGARARSSLESEGAPSIGENPRYAFLKSLLSADIRLFAPGLFGFEPKNLAGFFY